MLARELTADTIEQRESYLLRFFRRTRSSPENVTALTCDEFLAGVTRRSSKHEAYIAALRSFYRFAVVRGLLERDPTTDLHARSPKYAAPDYYKPEEVAAIIAAARRRYPPLRAPAIIALFETGAQIGWLAAFARRT